MAVEAGAIVSNVLIEVCEVPETTGGIGGIARDVIMMAILFNMALTIRPRQQSLACAIP